jgi:chloramphenicol-sensitive protein RarD
VTALRRGYLFGLAAYTCWGVFPLYFKLLRPAGAVEIVAHRIIWSLVTVALLLTALRGWRPVSRLVRRPRILGGVALAAAFIAVNWGVYIYGVNTDRVVETSLGYFINPLVTVLLGVLVLREHLRPGQWVALAVGAAAVTVLTVDYGRLPWIALALAFSFGSYGFMKKRLGLPAAEGLFLESAALLVPALAYATALAVRGTATFGHVSVAHTVLLIGSGVLTAGPLLLFAGAANRIPLTALGILQYLTPTIQFGIGVLVFHEPMPAARLAGFALVWAALTIFTWDTLRAARRATGAEPAVEPRLADVARH